MMCVVERDTAEYWELQQWVQYRKALDEHYGRALMYDCSALQDCLHDGTICQSEADELYDSVVKHRDPYKIDWDETIRVYILERDEERLS